MAERILMNEFKALSKERWAHIELHNEDIFRWNVALIVLNPDSMYYGGYFKATMDFPKNYPYSPPKFRFNRPIWHPNIYDTGDLCISILHSGGDDEMSGEKGAERWTPAQRVETVLLSILSLLDDAEPSSPANVEAGKMLRFDIHRYRSVVREHVELSKTDIPEGFVMPATHETSLSKPEIEKEDLDFWADSGDDDDDDDNDDDDDVFGGSDSSDFGDAGDDDGEMELDDAHDDDLDDSDDEDDNNKTKGKE